MKKGLILALTMVAMVALVMPVLALAPLVDPLPNVIIGDSEAGQISGANHLFTYNNVMNVANSSKITWRNGGLGFLAPQMHAYYLCNPVGGVQVSTPTRLVSEVTTTDIANIASAGAAPAAAKTITDAAGDGGLSDFWWLSLATNMSGATSSYTATAAANGKTIALTNVSPVDVTLFLADGDFPTTAVTQADSFTVYTVPTGADMISGGGVTVYSADFNAGAQNWVWSPYGDSSIAALPTGSATGGQLVQTAGTGATLRYGTWVSGTNGTDKGAVVDVQDALGTDIFRGTFSLTSTSASYTSTLAFRLLYFQLGFGHLGGITHYDANSAVAVAASCEANAPTASSPKEFKLYWAAPFQLTEMSDAGRLATVDPTRDLRHYSLNFDAIQTQAADSGNLALNNVLIETIDKPTAASTIVRWGTGANAFNNADSNIGWQDLAAVPVAGMPLGTATRSAASIVLTAGAGASGYKSVGLFGNATSLPTIVSDQLIICTATIATSAVNTTPTYRIINLSTLLSTGAAEALQWADVFDPNYANLKSLYAPGSSPCAPQTTATGIVSYIYTHTAHSAASKINPLVDCYQVGVPATGWPVPSGTLTMSDFKYELAN